MSEQTDERASLLADLQAWIEFALNKEIKYRQTGHDPKLNGYSYVEIPEWEMRQKLAAIRMELLGVTEEDIEETRGPKSWREAREGR